MTPFLLLCTLGFAAINAAEAILTMSRNYCSNSSTFATNSTYQANLNRVLADLISDASSDRNTGYSFNSSEAVYGSFMCKGDVSKKECAECVRNASHEIIHVCRMTKVSVLCDPAALRPYAFDRRPLEPPCRVVRLGARRPASPPPALPDKPRPASRGSNVLNLRPAPLAGRGAARSADRVAADASARPHVARAQPPPPPPSLSLSFPASSRFGPRASRNRLRLRRRFVTPPSAAAPACPPPCQPRCRHRPACCALPPVASGRPQPDKLDLSPWSTDDQAIVAPAALVVSLKPFPHRRPSPFLARTHRRRCDRPACSRAPRPILTASR
ncbi:hypothetical protein NL676_013109 [Syzygium grande]|nr:hypothetical protein NL676_013109 [Syzygium grande]